MFGDDIKILRPIDHDDISRAFQFGTDNFFKRDKRRKKNNSVLKFKERRKRPRVEYKTGVTAIKSFRNRKKVSELPSDHRINKTYVRAAQIYG